jgi:hypothetical protein
MYAVPAAGQSAVLEQSPHAPQLPERSSRAANRVTPRQTHGNRVVSWKVGARDYLLLHLLLHVSHTAALRIAQLDLSLQLLQNHLLLVLADLQRTCIGNLATGKEMKGKGMRVFFWGVPLDFERLLEQQRWLQPARIIRGFQREYLNRSGVCIFE